MVRKGVCFNEKYYMWISGPLPLDCTASLHTSSRSPKVCNSVPCRPEVSTHLGVSSTPQPHKREPARDTASQWCRRLGLFQQCWFAARDVIGCEHQGHRPTYLLFVHQSVGVLPHPSNDNYRSREIRPIYSAINSMSTIHNTFLIVSEFG